MKFIKKYKKCLFAFIAIVIIVFSSMISVFATGIKGGPWEIRSLQTLGCPALEFDTKIVYRNNLNSTSIHFNVVDVATSGSDVAYFRTNQKFSNTIFTNDDYYLDHTYLNPFNPSSESIQRTNDWLGSIAYQHLISFYEWSENGDAVPYSYSPTDVVLSVNNFYSWYDYYSTNLNLLDSGSQFSIRFFDTPEPSGVSRFFMPNKVQIYARQVGADDLTSITITDFNLYGITDYNFKFDIDFWRATDIPIDESMPLVFQVQECIFFFDNFYSGTELPNVTFGIKDLISFLVSYDIDPRFTGDYTYDFEYLPDLPPVNPDYEDFPLMPFANWLGGAVSGFLDLQLFPGFTLGGIFVTIFAFTCVVWFLKLVAGG